MDENKFLFVTCVNNEDQYTECKKHIEKLKIPTDYVLDFLPIRGATSMTEGYNKALSNDAKYKIYLHQDTYILNTNLLDDILVLFKSYPNLGMLGTIGCLTLPVSGIWWESKELAGKLLLSYNKQILQYTWSEIQAPYQAVDAIDGYLMITQYDLPWREDIIPDFHFYDISHCLEFKKKNYQVGIPKQLDYWCIHYVKHIHDFQKHKQYHNNFLKHYLPELVK